jgi:Golgi apparatus protein 1
MSIVFAASVAAIASPSESVAQSGLKDRLAAAVETVEGACAADISKFCSNVTRGEGRLLSCMQAYDDQLGRRCQFALYRVSRHLEGALNRVERIAEACWNDIEAHCGNADRIGQCVVEKRASLSQSCQTVVSGLRKAVQGLAALRGLPVYGSDNADLGQVIEVIKGPDGAVQSIQVEIGQALGIGPKVVTINADKFEQLVDRVRLMLGRDEVSKLPEAKKQ